MGGATSAGGDAPAPEPEGGAAGSEVEVAGAAVPASVGDSAWARRMSELGLADEPREVWRRPISERLCVEVRQDSALRLVWAGSEVPTEVLDSATGEGGLPFYWDIAAAITFALEAQKAVGHQVEGVASDQGPYPQRLDPRSGFLIVTDSGDLSRASTIAVKREGGAAWEIKPDRITKTLGYGWPLWVHDDHPDAEVLIPYATRFTDDYLWQLSDPFTGRPVWGTDWMQEPQPPDGAGPDPRRVVLALLPGGAPKHYDGLLGLSVEDGTSLWHIDYSALGRRYRYRKHPVYAGKSDHCVVLAELVRIPLCRCGWTLDSRALSQKLCDSCGRPFDFWATVQVHNRANGELLFRREWPDPEAPATEVADVLDIRSDVLLTREGSFVRGHSLPDGRQLWSMTPPTATTFDSSGRRPHSRWAWLRSAQDEYNVFLHARSGRTLNIPGAFHHTPDDLVITRTDDELVCWALPAGAGD